MVALTAAGAAWASAGSRATQPTTQPLNINITVGKDTTYAVEPVRKDGTVDYVAWMNRRASKGVTKDNNAAVGILRALGPEVLRDPQDREACRHLGVELPRKADGCFVTLEAFAESHPDLAPAVMRADTLSPEQEAQLAKLAAHVSKKELAQLRQIMLEGRSSAACARAQAKEAAMARPWGAGEHRLIRAWLKANARALDQIVLASRRPRFYVPLIATDDPPSLVSATLTPRSKLRAPARALVARAMMRAGENDFAGARADLLAVHRLARLVGQDPTLVGHLVSLSYESIAARGGQRLAAWPALPSAEAKRMCSALGQLPDMSSPADVIDVGERLFGLDAVLYGARHGLEGLQGSPAAPEIRDALRAQLPWDRVLRKFNRWYDRMAAAMRKKTYAQRQAAFEELDKDFENLARRSKLLSVRFGLRLLRGRAGVVDQIGDILCSLLLPAVGRASEIHDRGVMGTRLTQLAFALAAHRADKGAYPAKLSALAPAYIAAVPADRFTDKPLVYYRMGRGYLLYSLGPNAKDDGGRPQEDAKDDNPDAYDLAVRVK